MSVFKLIIKELLLLILLLFGAIVVFGIIVDSHSRDVMYTYTIGAITYYVALYYNSIKI